jgi:hypothetical protein
MVESWNVNVATGSVCTSVRWTTPPRSVSAYLESRHADQLPSPMRRMPLLLVDLDQPGAPDAIARA